MARRRRRTEEEILVSENNSQQEEPIKKRHKGNNIGVPQEQIDLNLRKDLTEFMHDGWRPS